MKHNSPAFIRLSALLFALSILALGSCGNEKADESNRVDSLRDVAYPALGSINSGEIVNGTYSNSYFGLSVPLPDSTCEILNAEQYEQRLESNTELMELSQSEIEKTKANVNNLFSFRKVSRVDSMGLFHGISFMREGISAIPGVHSALDYVYWTEDFLQKNISQGFPKYTSQGLDTAFVGQRVFLHSTWEIETEDGKTYFQETYTALFGEYLLNVIVNYQTPQEADENILYLSKVQWN